ncbi:MAG: peptidoglycan editing factor PgeF [candidate division Zixibacteria bacterium]|nr:peptidoglycan editing factor PgeF [candidate division Zixibacteria bacterium]
MNREWNKSDNGQISWLEFPELKNIPFVFSGLIVRNRKGKSFTIEASWKDKFKRFLRKQIGYAGGIVVPRQVHQNNVVSIKKSEKFSFRKKLQADALLTNQKGLFLTIQVADCVPIYILDTRKKVVGLVHAGWRGTLMQIAKDVVNEAKRNFNCSPEDLKIIFGPAIGKCCYEVKPEVAILFPSQFVSNKSGLKPKLDLIGFNRAQLMESGVKKKNIFPAGGCTFCGPKFLCSYRRAKNKKERMLAFIGIK